MELNKKLSKIDTYPFHMPGHKRNEKFNIPSANIDITEIDGYDNLHNPNDCLLELEKNYSKLYSSKKSILSVNGSTCCILSAISAACNFGDNIIIARNCHKSVYNACFIKKLNVSYIYPEINAEFNCFKAITQEQINCAIKDNPNAKAIVLTSPTYEGIISTIKSPIPLIIDAAHGAHFGFNDKFPEYPNADIVISSLHKTLPAMTQTAIINIYNDKYIKDVNKYMNIYETSSPSYVLMSSMDICCDVLKISKSDFDNLYDNCSSFRDKVRSNLKSFNILDNDDISRLCIKSTKLNGNNLAEILRNEYKIEIEMSCDSYIILIATIGDEKDAFDRLYYALENIEVKYNTLDDIKNEIKMKKIIPQKVSECYEIVHTKSYLFSKSENKICGEYLFAYPPGIPIIVPGEIVSKDIIEYIELAIKSGTQILGENGLITDKILTKC